uniref:sodium-coupled monocarboxylate transporter 2-like n=1 Tax=Styela clava TaxID=7725 RepID=UPI00193A776D|nr:sodium-coupled monocarboxylate transporter 2-like [Styela clava]
MESANSYFLPVDFVIFGGILFVSASIGVYFAYKDRKVQTTENYYFGRRNVSPIIVAMSLSVSYISALTVIGNPVEVYLYGTVYAWTVVANLIGFIAASIYYIPLYHRLRIKSVYEYLGRRFHSRIRSFASTMAMLELTFYLGITVYLPSLALSAVTPLELNWTIALTSILCTFYTSIGGMKAVIWTDVLQGVIMIAGMLAIFIQAIIMYGGFGPIIDAADRGDRNNLFKLDIDPRVRSTVWTIGGALGLSSCYLSCCSQVTTQRYMSCNSVRSSRIAALLQWIPGTIMVLLSIANGLIMYAYYEGCDPLLSGAIEKNDQAMPRLALEIFRDLPGMAGMFASAAFCGTLSTISSGVNSLSALALEDFVIPCFPAMSTTRKMVFSKVMTVIFGGVVMGIAYSVSLLSSNIIQINMITGAVAAPILSVFTMGMFMPWINSWGALSGMISGIVCGSWVALAAINQATYPATTESLPLSTNNCTVTNFLHNATTTLSTELSEDTTALEPMSTISEEYGSVLQYTLYSMSPFLYGTFAFFVSIIVGHIVSLFTGFNKISKADPDLFVPVINCKILRFGIPEKSSEEIAENSKENVFINSCCTGDDCGQDSLDSPHNEKKETVF